MKDIEEYFKPLTKDGQQVGMGLDVLELSGDRAFELYPKSKKLRAAFQQGFCEAYELSYRLQEQNEKTKKPESKIFIPNRLPEL